MAWVCPVGGGMKWEPIETAPKDTNILGWGEHMGMRTIEVDPDGFAWSDEGRHPVGAFTRWMPLPEPPEQT